MTDHFENTHVQRYQSEGFEYIKSIPEVKRFLDAEIFETIQFVRGRLIADNMIMLEFDVVAPNLMPHPRANLLKHGLVKRNNLLHSSNIEDGVSQTIGFFGNKLQIILNFHNQAATSANRD